MPIFYHIYIIYYCG